MNYVNLYLTSTKLFLLGAIIDLFTWYKWISDSNGQLVSYPLIRTKLKVSPCDINY